MIDGYYLPSAPTKSSCVCRRGVTPSVTEKQEDYLFLMIRSKFMLDVLPLQRAPNLLVLTVLLLRGSFYSPLERKD